MKVDGASGLVKLPNAGSCYTARRAIESCSRGLVFAVFLLTAGMSWAQTEQDGERIVVRKAGRFSSEDIHRAIFAKRPHRHTLGEMKEGIGRHLRKKHALG